MSYVKYIIQAHGGKIRLRSRENEGSTFTFIFQNKIKDGRKTQNFFFIDDDIALGHIYTMILQEEGYEVLYQTSLNGAKACIVETHPDMIVLDVEIGNKNGIEAVPELKAIAPNTLYYLYLHTQIAN